MNKWFYVMDMHSGGGRKTAFEIYFVEAADKSDAEKRFTDETGEDINDVACECCGANFSLGGPSNTLAEAAEFWVRGRGTVIEYITDPRNKVKVLPLTNEDISL